MRPFLYVGFVLSDVLTMDLRQLRWRILPRISLASLLFQVVLVTVAIPEQLLYESRAITPAGEYPTGIEGPAVNAKGDLFVANFEHKGTIGVLQPGATKSKLFATLPAHSVGNGIRFSREGDMYVADYKGHNVYVFKPGITKPQLYFHSQKFSQPNDLAIASDGTLFASDPDFSHGTGAIWMLKTDGDGTVHGKVMSSSRKMGVTNGIDLSPDGHILYVSESTGAEIWSYQIDGTTLLSPRRLAKFSTGELDGLRTDIDGRIFVTRPGNGTVTVLTSNGDVVREIKLKGKDPSNITFGGDDGKTVFVTQSSGGFIESFLTDRPGRDPCLVMLSVKC